MIDVSNTLSQYQKMEQISHEKNKTAARLNTGNGNSDMCKITNMHIGYLFWGSRDDEVGERQLDI